MRYELAIGPAPTRFADWTVESAERCLIEENGPDSAIELQGASAANWDNAEAAHGGFFDRRQEVLASAEWEGGASRAGPARHVVLFAGVTGSAEGFSE
ncbi:hypothetical protein [Streptomyces coeruleorubidus]|uniref:hypothetical protein n=1 Tax=Streptomyces coeruleorubidus TaxID=116188 RepID=UPI00364F33DE